MVVAAEALRHVEVEMVREKVMDTGKEEVAQDTGKGKVPGAVEGALNRRRDRRHEGQRH